jgi:hypothetical protein
MTLSYKQFFKYYICHYQEMGWMSPVIKICFFIFSLSLFYYFIFLVNFLLEVVIILVRGTINMCHFSIRLNYKAGNVKFIVIFNSIYHKFLCTYTCIRIYMLHL